MDIFKLVNDLLLTIQANPFADIVFGILVVLYILNRIEARKARNEADTNKIKLAEMESRYEVDKNNSAANYRIVESYTSQIQEAFAQSSKTIERLEGIDTSLKDLLHHLTKQSESDRIDYKKMESVLQGLTSSVGGETTKIGAGFMHMEAKLNEVEKRVEVIAGQNNRIVGEVIETQSEVYKAFEIALQKAIGELTDKLIPQKEVPPLLDENPVPPAPS